MKYPVAAITLAIAWVAGPASAIDIDFVPVGDPGNPNGPQGYGGVAYTYAIGKYEVTLDQYAAFLNAVATTDTNALWYSIMGTDLNVGTITRNGTSGSYTYTVNGDGSRPVSRVSWFDAARFVNWVQNGQPVGLQDASTTEDGAYTLTGSPTEIISKNASASYWIPSRSEGDKAAYYQPAAAGGDTDGYWAYATGSNTQPNSRNGSTTDENSANYNYNDGIANGYNGGYAVTNSPTYDSSQNYLTPVGAFTQSGSYYGTFGQNGNVAEWVDYPSATHRQYRGGHWMDYDANELQPTGGHLLSISSDTPQIGFRIATVPEPSAAAALVLGAGMLAGRRMRRRQVR